MQQLSSEAFYFSPFHIFWLVPVLLVVILVQGCATAGLGAHGQRKLTSKTIVIIGASSGLGRGVALRLGRCNANVVIAAPRKDYLDEVAAEIRAAGGTALVVPMDV